MHIKKIGAGTIGRGVAQSFAEHDFDVVLLDRSEEQLRSAVRQVERDVKVLSLLEPARPRFDAAGVLGRITGTREWEALAEVDFVVENVTEDWEVKREVHLAVDRHAPPGAINTFAIRITRLAALTGRLDRVVGAHFVNPVPLMPMVGVVRGHHTSQDTLDVTCELLAAVGKDAVVVNDMAGFITNRVLMPTINEAIFCVQDGVAEARDVDRIFKGCFGHRMGPLETADLIGLDTILNSITVLYQDFKDPKYRPAHGVRQLAVRDAARGVRGAGVRDRGGCRRPGDGQLPVGEQPGPHGRVQGGAGGVTPNRWTPPRAR